MPWICGSSSSCLLCPSWNLSRLNRTLEISVRTSWWCFWPMRPPTTLLSCSSFGRPHSWPSLGPNLEHSSAEAFLPHIARSLLLSSYFCGIFPLVASQEIMRGSCFRELPSIPCKTFSAPISHLLIVLWIMTYGLRTIAPRIVKASH